MEAPEVVITRDSQSHKWAFKQGSHLIPTPWEDTANVVHVIMDIKTKANGNVKVRVE
jgi:hypothetical protein